MIDQQRITKEWVESVSQSNSGLDKTVSFQKYRLPEDVKDVMIEDPSIIKLNRLKKVNPEAFYYWYLISRMQVQDDED